LDRINWDQSLFFIGGGKRKKKDARRKKKIVLVPAYRDVGCRSLSACSQPTCWVYACVAFYLIFYTGLGLSFGAV